MIWKWFCTIPKKSSTDLSSSIWSLSTDPPKRNSLKKSCSWKYTDSSVTRWLDYFSIIWPCTTMKICPMGKEILPKKVQNFAKYWTDPLKAAKIFQDLAIVAKFRQLWSLWYPSGWYREHIIGNSKLRFHSLMWIFDYSSFFQGFF